MREQRLSPKQFDVLQRSLLRLEVEGRGPEICVIEACKEANIPPPNPFEEVSLVVDYSIPNGDR